MHVMHAFDVGGLENGVVNLINHMPSGNYRHAVLALTEITDFRQRVRRDDVTFIALGKKPGHAVPLYARLYRLFRAMRPAIIHTRNLAALELTAPAWAAGVPVRLHGEHGRDVGDLDGTNRKYRWVRRAYRPFVSHYVALSRDLENYLVRRVGIAQQRVSQIYNGVDTAGFRPARPRAAIAGSPFDAPELWLVGSVGRMQAVKDPLNLARAFVQTLQVHPTLRKRLRLVIAGDGPLLPEVSALLDSAGVRELAWLPGNRNDVPDILRGLDCFVLPSLGEGISNTVLEAMASGLPVIGTAVGGNPELIITGVTGELVPAADPAALAQSIARYAADPALARRAGQAGRLRVEQHFSLDAMVARYQRLYDELSDPSRNVHAGRVHQHAHAASAIDRKN